MINGDDYLIQEMWSNAADGGQGQCVQDSSATASNPGDGLPLPQVNLTQFSNTVSGNVNEAGITVTVNLLRQTAADAGDGGDCNQLGRRPPAVSGRSI